MLSVDFVRWVLNAGGGPVEVSIPWLLRDAGGRFCAGDRASVPDDVGLIVKYDSAGEAYDGGEGLCVGGLEDLDLTLAALEVGARFVVEKLAAEDRICSGPPPIDDTARGRLEEKLRIGLGPFPGPLSSVPCLPEC